MVQTNVSLFRRGIQRRRKLTLPHKVTLSPHFCSFTYILQPILFSFTYVSLTSFSFILALLHSLLLTLLTLPILPLHLHYLRYSFFLFLFLAIIFDTASRRPNGADSQQILGDGVGLSDPYHGHAHSLRRGWQSLLISPFFTSFIPAYVGASTPSSPTRVYTAKYNYSKTPNSAKVKQNGPLIWCTFVLNYTVI